MALSTVTVTWDETGTGLAAVAGTIVFTLSAALTDVTDGLIVEPVPQYYPFIAGTGTSGPLVANDNVGASPSGTYYTVEVAITGQPSRSFNAPVNHAAGATQTLAYLESQAIA
jgi:hypothetical protein